MGVKRCHKKANAKAAANSIRFLRSGLSTAQVRSDDVHKGATILRTEASENGKQGNDIPMSYQKKVHAFGNQAYAYGNQAYGDENQAYDDEDQDKAGFDVLYPLRR